MSEQITSIDLGKVRIDPSWALRVPATLALRRLMLPLAQWEGRVYVACANPRDQASLDAIARHLGLPVVPVAVDQAQLRRVLNRVYWDARRSSETGAVAGGGGGQRAATGGAAGAGGDDALEIVDEILLAAILRQASDIHIDPERDHVRVRLRVDGNLEEYRRLPNSLQAALCSRVKVLARMDIAERRAPQDGAFTHRYGPPDDATTLGIRVASLPVKYGERLTMRLLASQAQRLTLGELGLSAADLGKVERVLAQPHGLVLLTGPTGSGKSTTLYAAIQWLLAHDALNILTVEDPIEYEIPGVGQAEIDSADKVSFNKALRSLLRHDPDIVMIGEIRDTESLDVAIKASLTGHLVLSTLHTNNALGVVTRLADMGVAPHMVGATLRLSVAQRLVRRLCPHCRVEGSLSAVEAEALGRPEASGRPAFAAKGCLYCAGRGLAGRIGLFECFTPDRAIGSLIAGGVTEAELYEAVRGGPRFHALLDDAIEKITTGACTVGEVMQVAAEA
jgi:type IV pilus assembly protein PilB